jgi:serine/threonine-protein kinase RsbW
MDRADRQVASQELGAAVRLDFVLCMPRMPGTVALVRHVFDGALAALGVADACRAEIVLAASEACSNAVEHALHSGDYRVAVVIKQGWCTVEVVDTGVGMNGRVPARAMPPPAVYGGRGLPIMRAVTDTLDLRPTYPSGLTVGFTKQLRLEDQTSYEDETDPLKLSDQGPLPDQGRR